MHRMTTAQGALRPAEDLFPGSQVIDHEPRQDPVDDREQDDPYNPISGHHSRPPVCTGTLENIIAKYCPTGKKNGPGLLLPARHLPQHGDLAGVPSRSR